MIPGKRETDEIGPRRSSRLQHRACVTQTEINGITGLRRQRLKYREAKEARMCRRSSPKTRALQRENAEGSIPVWTITM